MLKTKQFKPGDYHPTIKPAEKKEREKDIERYFREEIKRRGGKSWKFSSPANAGVYDRIAVLPGGATWFVELKTMTGRLSGGQQQFCKEINELGGNEVVLYGMQGVKAWLDYVIPSPTT